MRYRITQGNNAGPQISVVARGLLTEVRPMLTYADLLRVVGAAVRRECGVATDAPDPQPLLNRRYQLRQLIRAAGKQDDSAIDEDFDDAFGALCAKAVSMVPSQRTQGDVRRGLGWWRKRFQEVLSEHQRGAGRQPVGSFATILGRGMANHDMTHARAAGIASVPASTLSSWLQGVVPHARSATGLARLEAALELTPGALTTLARQPKPQSRPAPASGYRQRIRALRTERYRLPLSEFSPQLRDEWQALLRYKTSKSPDLKRSRRAVWRLASGIEGQRNANWYNTVGTSFCATADVEIKHVTSYFGFLRNKSAEHGHDFPPEWEPTLAAFAVPELVERYINWLIARADGVANNRIGSVSNFLQSLTAKETGWLTQQPALAERLPASVRTRTWVDACSAVNRIATAFRGDARGTSRDPFEPLRGLLALAEPYAPILEAIRLLDLRAVSAGLQSSTAAVAKRDALLLTVLMSVPLRLKNLVLLRYRADGTGTLRKEPDGRWWIRIPPHETKNRKAIDAPLPKSATGRIDEYVAIYRRRLLGTSQCDYVLLPGKTRKAPWWTLSQRVFLLTRIYIAGCMGFHVHSFRHLAATRWLEKHPEDYPTVAHLLGDDLQTVIRTYSRPSPAKAIDRASLDIDALIDRLA